jgi:signal transduction histidine kinase
LLRHAAKKIIKKGFLGLLSVGSLLFFSACNQNVKTEVDRLNDVAYSYHYRNLDSTRINAERALSLADGYSNGKAEALNNLAFVNIVKMDFSKARTQLTEAIEASDNQVEQLVADIQLMRLCQRVSENKSFYDYREHAQGRLKRINEERNMLSEREKKRLVYAESEYSIVTSTYYYYVGLERQSITAIKEIDPNGEIQKDTAQMLNYLYMMGSGGLVEGKDQFDINQQEFDYLMRCLFVANDHHYEYWVANSCEALAEHLVDPRYRDVLIRDNYPYMMYLNPAGIPDSILCIELANKALERFVRYGDAYQIGGAYRTLASCYMSLNDYGDAIICFERALNSNKELIKAPELIASIREQMSVAYSAIGNKQQSDYNRNIYLDLQEMTRQDRYLESRAAALDRESSSLDVMIAAIILMIVILIFLLYVFNHLRNKKSELEKIESLLKPLQEWKDANILKFNGLKYRFDNINEEQLQNQLHVIANKQKNLEQRAKVSLVTGVIPFIDRIINEVNRLKTGNEGEDIRKDRFNYIAELTDKINEYNEVLTQWIQLRQGEVSLHIESFPIQPLFDIVSKSKTSFHLKGVTLNIEHSDAVVKADMVLTLFMINTLADNARKFTSAGGIVTLSAKSGGDYVEISVSDTGTGMSEDELENIFNHKIYNGHGFGLVNCKGIIEKYRKMSTIFANCMISAESKEGQGSRFYFRLPKGLKRTLAILLLLLPVCTAHAESILQKAGRYADSTYYSNIHARYDKALVFADSARRYLNEFYLLERPRGMHKMVPCGTSSETPAEILWLHDSLKTNYDIILDIRNESAVAALALKKWDLYNYNNKVYTQLFKELSADNTLSTYCHNMQKSQTNKNVAIILLIILLLMILPAYYLLYYRHRLYYRFCVERVNKINDILLEKIEPEDKLKKISMLANEIYPKSLQSIVAQIKTALHDTIGITKKQNDNIELADGERRRTEYENNILHISNSVLDNCLSTLKHETMYYPNRIKQLIEDEEKDINAISEVVDYYRDIYGMLSSQALRQVEIVKFKVTVVPVNEIIETDSTLKLIGDKDMLKYLFEILTKQSKDKRLNVKIESSDDIYVSFVINLPHLILSKERCDDLFTPNVDNITFLLCKQIVRDHSEFTNHRGCRIMAEPAVEGINILIMLPKKK